MELTDADRQAIKDKLKFYETISKEEARAYLVKLGTHDENGNLKPKYGGKGWKKLYGAQ